MLLCPWDFPGTNTGVGCYFLLQKIFLIQGSNLCLLHWQADSLPLSHLGSPWEEHIHIYLLKNYIWAGDFSHLDKNWVHPNGEGQRNYVKDLRPVFALPVSPDCILGNYYLSLTLSKISDSFQFDNVTIVLSWDLSQRKTLYKWSFRYQDSFLEPWQVCNPIECQLFYILGIWFWSLLRPGNICKCFWIWITFIRVPRWEVNGRT